MLLSLIQKNYQIRHQKWVSGQKNSTEETVVTWTSPKSNKNQEDITTIKKEVQEEFEAHEKRCAKLFGHI